MNEELTGFEKYQKFYPGVHHLSQKYFFPANHEIHENSFNYFKDTCDLNSELTT